MLKYTSKRRNLKRSERTVSRVFSMVVFGGFVLLGIRNFFFIGDNKFMMVINTLGLILNFVMFIAAVCAYIKIDFRNKD